MSPGPKEPAKLSNAFLEGMLSEFGIWVAFPTWDHGVTDRECHGLKHVCTAFLLPVPSFPQASPHPSNALMFKGKQYPVGDSEV